MFHPYNKGDESTVHYIHLVSLNVVKVDLVVPKREAGFLNDTVCSTGDTLMDVFRGVLRKQLLPG